MRGENRHSLCNLIFEGLGKPHLHGGLGFDVNLLARRGVAAHARFAVRFHDFADTGNVEGAVLLGL